MASLTNLLLTFANLPLGTRFTKFLKTMQKVQWCTKEELQARSEQRLALLLKHAAINVPFYQNVFRELGFKPDEVHTVDDLRVLPILSKYDYWQGGPETFRATNVKPGLHIERKTSGSTGEPFQFSIDRRALPVIFASHLFYDSWHGLQPFDRYIRIVGPLAAQPSLASGTPAAIRLQRAVTNRLQKLYEGLTQEKLWLSEVDAELAEKVWRRMEAFRPKFVMGYTSTLAAIADELLRRDLRLSRHVRGVIVIAETLTPSRRKLIEDYFAAPIINRYGLREFGSWSAQSCRESPIQFHINTELVVCEILRQDGSPCAPGETGRVVLTDLHNFARPFIRYDTGDRAVALSESCACGRGFPLLGPIEGRSLESVITPSGGELGPTVLGHYLFVYRDHLEAVRQYQLVQEARDRVSLLIVPGEQWNEHRQTQIRADLMQLIGEGMDVTVKTVSEIPPEKSGKRPIIKRAPDR